jgi:outer membrane protein assembly factor BamA
MTAQKPLWILCFGLMFSVSNAQQWNPGDSLNVKQTVTYDSRDNAFAPTRGINAEMSLNYSAEWLGCSDDFSVLNTDFFAYLPVTSRLNSAWRFQGSYLLGDALFMPIYL